ACSSAGSNAPAALDAARPKNARRETDMLRAPGVGRREEANLAQLYAPPGATARGMGRRAGARSAMLPVWGAPGVPVGRVSRDQVTDPTEKAAGAKPQSRRDDQPEDAPDPRAVVDLANAGDDQAEQPGRDGIPHRNPPSGQVKGADGSAP